MIRVIIQAEGCDPNTGNYKTMRTVDIQNKELERALFEFSGRAWIIGSETLGDPYTGDKKP